MDFTVGFVPGFHYKSYSELTVVYYHQWVLIKPTVKMLLEKVVSAIVTICSSRVINIDTILII